MTEQWFCIEAVEGRTSLASLTLIAAGFETWRPFATVRAPKRRSKPGAPPRKDRTIPRFGRYFFVRAEMTPWLIREVNAHPAMRGFLRSRHDAAPTAIDDRLIAFLKSDESQRDAPVDWKDGVWKGKRVTISPDYPLWANMTGTIEAIDSRGVLKISLDNRFGPSIPVLIEVGHVETLSDGQATEGKKSRGASGAKPAMRPAL